MDVGRVQQKRPRAASMSAKNEGQPPVKRRNSGKRKRSAPFPAVAKAAKRAARPSPTFLMGGTVSDPLNLSGLPESDVKENDQQQTPPQQPAKDADDEKIAIVIPKNPKDPLNLLPDRPHSTVGHRRARKRKRHNSLKMLDSDVSGLLTDNGPGSAKGALSDSELPSHSPPTSEGPSFTEEQPSEREAASIAAQPSSTQSTSAKGQQQIKKKEKFRYGNYIRYYGKRIACQQLPADPRLPFLQCEWFENRVVLDVGCNMGHLTINIAQQLRPRHIVGIDIDPRLVSMARKNLRTHLHYTELDRLKLKFPPSFIEEYGPIVAPPVAASRQEEAIFPRNILFKQANYVLESEALLETIHPEYDTIVAFSLTKWVQLNWGDDGLKIFFKRVYRNLKPGGYFLLEAQHFSSYRKRKNICPEIAEHYKNIKLLPDSYAEYLLSSDVGFASHTVIGTPQHSSKGFQRPIQLFTKPS